MNGLFLTSAENASEEFLVKKHPELCEFGAFAVKYCVFIAENSDDTPCNWRTRRLFSILVQSPVALLFFMIGFPSTIAASSIPQLHFSFGLILI